jgi:hypothetical protein
MSVGRSERGQERVGVKWGIFCAQSGICETCGCEDGRTSCDLLAGTLPVEAMYGRGRAAVLAASGNRWTCSQVLRPGDSLHSACAMVSRQRVATANNEGEASL